MLGASSVRASLGSSRDKLGSMAAALKAKATTAAHTAESALKNSAQAVRSGAQVVESAMKQSVCSAKEKLDGFRKLGMTEPLFAAQEEHAGVAQLVQMGFSRRAAARALEAADNDVAAAASFLCEAVAMREGRTRSTGGTRSRPRHSDHARSLAEFSSLRDDFELQLGLARSIHSHAMEQLEDLTLAQLLQDTAAEVESPSEPIGPAKSNFLPSVGTWLLPLPLRLQVVNPQENASPSLPVTPTESEPCKLDEQAEKPLEVGTSIDGELPKPVDAEPICRASRCGA